MNILLEKSCTFENMLAQVQKKLMHRRKSEAHKQTLNAVENPSSQTALVNFLGSAPPVFGSNLLFTSAIKSQPLSKTHRKSINMEPT